MTERVQWTHHKGKDILIITMKDANEEQFDATMDQLVVEFKKRKDDNKTILVVFDLRDMACSFNRDRLKKGKEAGELANTYAPRKAALVGFGSIQRMIVNALRRDDYFASSMEDAKEWLVKQV